MKVLVLGTTGMLGSALFRTLSKHKELQVIGAVRNENAIKKFDKALPQSFVKCSDLLNPDEITRLIAAVKPDVVVNCVGLIKQLPDSSSPLVALPVNSMFPHRLARVCDLSASRLIHISTDCVFSGRKGMYKEEDKSDAEDLYGKSKFIGEIHDQPHVLTLRTSIIGHELSSCVSLIDWFLSQEGVVSGYTKAIFSGFPTVELSNLIARCIIDKPEMSGLYHVSADPIAKYDLLKLVSDVYEKDVVIEKDDKFIIDRSLDSTKFREELGYEPPDWKSLITMMREERDE